MITLKKLFFQHVVIKVQKGENNSTGLLFDMLNNDLCNAQLTQYLRNTIKAGTGYQ